MSNEKNPNKRPWFWRGLHWVFILHLLLEIAYCAYMIFFVLRPEGISGPLGSSALEIPHELMVTRRLYAIESWVATVGLILYLAITEPRLRVQGQDKK